MWISHRLRSGLRRTALALLIVVACSWVSLYLDSVHQRREAERLISELKSFPFATAGFDEVRELAERNGGAAIQQFPLLEFPQYGYPFEDSQGHVHMPLLENGGPTCTVRDCTFRIWIRPWHLRAFPRDRAEVLLTFALKYSGISPWGVYATLIVKGGKLNESHTEFGRLGPATLGRFTGLVPLAYEVVSAAHSELGDRSPDYSVGAPHITGGPLEGLSVHFPQTSNAPTRRAFDVDLRCVTAVWRSCRGFDELAPSAWADYQSELKK